MKKNIVILSTICFIFTSFLLYVFIEYVYVNRISLALSSAQKTSISLVDAISPEIKASFLKPDDISLLYSIERMSKIKNITEVFIIDKQMNVLIHNDSSKWNKKYNEDVFVNAVSSKDKMLQKLNTSSFVYSLPINENSFLCTIFSLDEILNNFKIWKMKLYVLAFVLSFAVTFCIYYLLKFFFLRPFLKAKKYLSLNERNKKTIYSDLINMAFQTSEIANEKLDNIESKSGKIKELFKYALERLQYSGNVFAVLDDSARILYCFDPDKNIFDKQDINSHIVNAVSKAGIIQTISKIIADPHLTEELDIENLKVQLIPVKNESGGFIGILITANIK
ncbi:MAG: hypothetical protein WC234_04045 [Endomicrobiaceae bacterium]